MEPSRRPCRQFSSWLFLDVLTFPKRTLIFLQWESYNNPFRKAFTRMLSFLFLLWKLTQFKLSSAFTSWWQGPLSTVSFQSLSYAPRVSASQASILVATSFPCSSPQKLPIAHKIKVPANVLWPQLPSLPRCILPLLNCDNNCLCVSPWLFSCGPPVWNNLPS